MDLAATPIDLSSENAPAADNASEAPRQSGATANENKFQQAIAAWRNVNLGELMPALDTAASDLVEHQRDALTQRKDLAQKTKDFRKLDDASKLTEIKGLLKAYQNFIDVLTNQSKSISAAFFQAYTPLSEAPDPYPLLEASVDSIVTAEETVPKLTEENQRLQKTVSNLTSQLETTEKKYEEELSARKELEESRDAKIKEVEASWTAVLTEKKDNWEAKEKALEEKVENQDRLLKELKASYEVSQRLGKGEDDEDDKALGGATAAELEIVSSELDRTNTRLAEVEARNEQLRLELAQSASNANSTQASVSVEDDPSFRRLQSENQSLLRKLDAARYEKDSDRRKLETDTRTLEREVAALKQDRDALREKVNSWGDYENVKRELEVLKSIEFATGEEEDLDAADDTTAEGAKGSKGKGETLEQLLLARNKKLSNELTVLRVSHQDLQTRLEQMQEELSNTNMELEKSQNLAATLENDLMKVQQEASNAFDSSAMSVAGTHVSRYPQSSFAGRKGGRSSPTSSIISGFDPRGGSNTLEAIRAGEPVGGGSGILPMVTAQRDRFKKKNAELESELQKAWQTVSSLRSEVASLQKDNLNLYEKTRYVSTYNRGQSTAYSTSTNPSTIQVTSDTSSNLDRYRSAYEQNISPFAAFRGRESARAFKRMSLPERMVFRITKMVLATRTSRNLFAAYCVALHLLVFWMLLSGASGPVEETVSLSNSGSAAAGGAAAGGPLAAAGANDKGHWKEEGFGDS